MCPGGGPGPVWITQLFSQRRNWRSDLPCPCTRPCPWKRPSAAPSAAPPGGEHSPDASASPSESSANLAAASAPGTSVCPSCVPGTRLFLLSRDYRKQASTDRVQGNLVPEPPTNTRSWPLGPSASVCSLLGTPTHRASVSPCQT